MSANFVYKYKKYYDKIDNLLHEFTMHGGGEKSNILIVVDVQRCFFEDFGTMGWQPKSGSKVDRKNVADEFAKRIKEIVNDNYGMVVFTKDSHPSGHKSFNIFPSHCIDIKKDKCTGIGVDDSTIDSSINLSDDISSVNLSSQIDIKTKGHDLSLDNENDVKYDYKISLNNISELNKYTNIKDIDTSKHILYEKSDGKQNIKIDVKDINIKNKNKTIIRLNKGELCNFDSYSAFVYHIYYGDSINDILADDIYTEYNKLSTGLYELITSVYGSNDITIDVCGLVTNICVVNTCIAGYKMFKKYNNANKNKIKIRLLNDCSLTYHPMPSAIAVLEKSKIPFIVHKDIKECTLCKDCICIINKKAADDTLADGS